MHKLSFTAFLRFLAMFKTEELDTAIQNIAHHIKTAREQQQAGEPLDLDYLVDMASNDPEWNKKYVEEMLEDGKAYEDENRYKDWLREKIAEIVL